MVTTDSLKNKEAYMRQCLTLAETAYRAGEVPVGALIVQNDQVIATASNAQISACDPTAHAEINALRAAAQVIGNYRLVDCTIYTTVEPCLMCAGAMLHARIDQVVYGASEPRAGAANGPVNYFSKMAHVHKLEVIGGVLEYDCRLLIQQFFRARR